MSIKIIKPGLQASIQDLGRNCGRPLGIGPGGAMDFFACSIANFIAGNDEHAAVIEINFPGPEIVFEQDAVIAIAGATFGAMADEQPILPCSLVLIKKNTLLKFTNPVSGSKACLAVHKGWTAEKWMESYSTHFLLQAGGFYGRSLQKGDTVSFPVLEKGIKETTVFHVEELKKELSKIYIPSNIIRCIQGPEWLWLHDSSKENFTNQEFTLSGQGNRMGYRFINAPLNCSVKEELVSSGVDMGVVQLLPDGNIITLMADHQTTGGYPRIASVIKPDLPKLAQRKPGEKISFTLVSADEAEQLLIDFTGITAGIKNICHHHFKQHSGFY